MIARVDEPVGDDVVRLERPHPERTREFREVRIERCRAGRTGRICRAAEHPVLEREFESRGHHRSGDAVQGVELGPEVGHQLDGGHRIRDVVVDRQLNDANEPAEALVAQTIVAARHHEQLVVVLPAGVGCRERCDGSSPLRHGRQERSVDGDVAHLPDRPLSCNEGSGLAVEATHQLRLVEGTHSTEVVHHRRVGHVMDLDRRSTDVVEGRDVRVRRRVEHDRCAGTLGERHHPRGFERCTRDRPQPRAT